MNKIAAFLTAALVFLTTLSGAAVTVESLDQPCRAKNILSGRVITDRSTGTEWLVLCNTNEASNVELLFIDFHNNTGKVFTAPAGQGAWALQKLPNDRLALGTYYDGKFLIFDLKKMAFIKTIQFPGEQYIWRFAMGKDGRLYGGTYPGAKLGALDPRTYALQTWNNAAPPNLYLRYVNSTADGRILCTYSTQRPCTLVFDPATDAFSTTTAAMNHLTVCSLWNGYILNRNNVCDGKTLQPVNPPPFPVPNPDDGGWSVLPNITSRDVLHLKQKNKIFRYRKGDKKLTLVAKLDPRLGAIWGMGRGGELVGTFGQDYFVIHPGDKETRLRPIPVKSGGRPPHFLRADGHGRLWGGPLFGQTLFYVDLKTSKAVNTGIVSNRGGEVYDVAFVDGKVYAVSYVGGEIIRYDPEQPWDEWNNRNPHVIASVGPNFIRPEAGVDLGPHGNLYAGWSAKYGTYGGAVSITDPKTGKTEILRDPLGTQAICGLALGPKQIYVGTSLGGNGLPVQPNARPKFGVIDLATRKVVFQHVIKEAGINSLPVVLYDPVTKIVVCAANKRFFFYNVAKQKFEPADMTNLPQQTGGVVAPGNGTVLYGSGDKLIVLDIRSRKVTRTETLPAKIEKLTRDTDGTLFFSSGPNVYRVTLK